MREAIQRRFGVGADGLWLTERVWEPELAADLAEAGVRYALVDDRHFLVTGFRPEQLHAPLWTESDGRPVALFPIDERLRYLIPFRPPEETADYLRTLRDQGHRLAVLADDGEKFGGWPGTREWVYERGWLDRFMDTIHGLIGDGVAELSTLSAALDAVPSGGLAYLPTASYREMEAWSLPPDAAVRLLHLERDLGEQRMAGPDGALVRGAHWRNFLVKYPESNRMHKKMQALSALSRERGDTPEVRRAIGRAQCNDAYWHGVFGGLYLPHLREAVWANLAVAESRLRAGEPIACDVVDFDGDGHREVWIHSAAFSAVVSPARGAAVEEYTVFASGRNHADVLTRRREAYHDIALDPTPPPAHAEGGAPSIHEIEEGIRLTEWPPLDRDDRAIFQERVLPGSLTPGEYSRGGYPVTRSWARTGFSYQIVREPKAIELDFRAEETNRRGLIKRLRFEDDGIVSAHYEWDADAGAPGDFFAVELSLFRPLGIVATPDADVWSHPVETIAKSERGLDRTVQGESVTLRWPVELGAASVRLTP